ncbi:MAG: 50S ribosomal protein L35 [Candidatus Liptonbacteria bacterium]|nr:50S ribosomal protein L35 [Candidatus Liptonbacteria bacterium]
MANKTSKSLTKRIRITRTGKLIRRKMGIDHFKTNKTKKVRRQMRNNRSLGYSVKKMSQVSTYTS